MTTTPVMSITDDQIAEIERDIAAQASIKHGQCEGGVVVRGEICRECGATPKDSCRRPLPKSYAVPSNITALISRLRAAEKDAERLEFMMANQAIIWSMNGLDMPTVYSVSWNGMGKDRHDKWFDTERAAIDTAMEQSK